MIDKGLHNSEKFESEKQWKKCVWKSYHLTAGEQSLGESMHGIAILAVIQGVIGVTTSSGADPLLFREHDICLLSESPPYKVEVSEEAHVLVCIFQLDIFPFDKDMLSSLMPFFKRDERNHIPLEANEVIRSFTGLMEDYLQKGLESDLLFDMKRQELFLLLFATYPRRELAAFFYPLIGEGIQFKEFVIGNYIKAKNVQHLAQMANYSTSGFIKKFIRYFNESPYHWMLRHKAKIILDEICSSQISLKEIAFKYNFSTYQHFVDFCKMQFGVAPSRLR